MMQLKMKLYTRTLALMFLLLLTGAPCVHAGSVFSEVVNEQLTINLPANKSMTVLNFSQQGDPSTRARLVVTKGGFSLTVRAATQIINLPQSDDVYSGQVVIAGPAEVIVFAPGQTVFFTYKLQAN